MKKAILTVSIFLVLLLAVLFSCLVYAHPYPKDLMAQEWNDDFWKSFPASRRNLLEEKTQAIRYSRSMAHTLYDPLMGGFGDVLGKQGLVVCVDVPVRSYLAAGISLPALLRESAQAHPEWFQLGPSNSPRDGYFYRRVRNYYDLFRKHAFLETSQESQVGDWAFYGRFHIALVTSVGTDGSYELMEAAPHRIRVAATTGAAMAKTWGKPDFFGRIRSVQP